MTVNNSISILSMFFIYYELICFIVSILMYLLSYLIIDQLFLDQ